METKVLQFPVSFKEIRTVRESCGTTVIFLYSNDCFTS